MIGAGGRTWRCARRGTPYATGVPPGTLVRVSGSRVCCTCTFACEVTHATQPPGGRSRGSGPLPGARHAARAGPGVEPPVTADARHARQRRAGGRLALVRFLGGTRPGSVWTDRNGDGKADMIEVYRGGALAYQLIDADYDGTANVLRVYNGGSLVREERL